MDAGGGAENRWQFAETRAQKIETGHAEPVEVFGILVVGEDERYIDIDDTPAAVPGMPRQ